MAVSNQKLNHQLLAFDRDTIDDQLLFELESCHWIQTRIMTVDIFVQAPEAPELIPLRTQMRSLQASDVSVN